MASISGPASVNLGISSCGAAIRAIAARATLDWDDARAGSELQRLLVGTCARGTDGMACAAILLDERFALVDAAPRFRKLRFGNPKPPQSVPSADQRRIE